MSAMDAKCAFPRRPHLKIIRDTMWTNAEPTSSVTPRFSATPQSWTTRFLIHTYIQRSGTTCGRGTRPPTGQATQVPSRPKHDQDHPMRDGFLASECATPVVWLYWPSSPHHFVT